MLHVCYPVSWDEQCYTVEYPVEETTLTDIPLIGLKFQFNEMSASIMHAFIYAWMALNVTPTVYICLLE